MRRDHHLQEPPRYLLFVKLLGLGSLVIATGSIQALRQKMPNTRFILLTDANIAAGIEPFGVFDEIWPVHTSSLFITITNSIRYIIRSWRLKKLWVADLEVYSKLTTVYALLTMARNRFGFHLPPVFFRKFLNTHNIPFEQGTCLEDNYLHMAQVIANTNLLPRLEQNRFRSNEWEKPYILVNNTCSKLALVRKLPDETVAAICHWILNHTLYRIAFLGAANDRNDINRFIDQYLPAYTQHGLVTNMAGVLDFKAYYRFISEKAACIVTIDSGPLHLARKLGLPTISVWGPTNPAHYLKMQAGEENRHLYCYNKTACSPCVHRFEQLPCKGNNVCMKEIPAERIIERISRLLEYHSATFSLRNV
ncbi:glycosyltransferase family 9 protein [Longitalea arenae]|uniref:glycosyltransferase family 9 protein n=1 Tax=Longitalea arenae TaxID=2812558 RepID=UPI001966E63B|nr:glycosyltransferase family 9 protein [Longitalea arenae]